MIVKGKLNIIYSCLSKYLTVHTIQKKQRGGGMDIKLLTHRVVAKASLYEDISPDLIEKLCQEEALGEHPDSLQKLINRVITAMFGPDENTFVVVPDNCSCSPGEQHCASVCVVDAIGRDSNGKTKILDERCVDCGLCVEACDAGAIVEKAQCRELAKMMSTRQAHPLYAILAPAFAGQFGATVSDASVKGWLRRLGFTDVYEVALAADILTTVEADEFIARSRQDGRFMITSCCCPAFIKLVEKHRPKVAHLVSEAVSPMIALGRLLKSREPHCRVVFIGPCLAKRAESRRPELRDAVDAVLTFKEIEELLGLAGIDTTARLAYTSPLCDASRDGRRYAHTGGVTEAIRNAVRQKAPELAIKSLIGNGLKQCNEILSQIEAGKVDGNFMEGMGCPGGCVGGPGTLVAVDDGARIVKSYAYQARMSRARDNELAQEWLKNYGDGLNKKA